MLEVHKNNSSPTEFNFGDISLQKGDSNSLELYGSFNEPCFSGWYKELIYSDLKIGYGELSIIKPSRICVNYTDSTIEMIFFLSGNTHSQFSTEQKHYFKGNTHNLFHCANDKGFIEFQKKKISFINILLAPSFFKDFMPDEKAFDTFKSLIKTQQTGYIQNDNVPITPSMQMILDDLIDSPWKGNYQKMFIHSKVLELLLLQLNQCKYDLSTPPSSLSDTDTLKIYQAKQYVSRHYNDQITISKLAKIIGTNEFTLKKGFKEVIGTTVFGYINDLKMYKAKKLLAQKNISITQVSELVGYKNPQHFSTAFKKKFGIVPSKFKG